MPSGYVYMLTNAYNNLIYTGVTSNLINRISQHKEKYYRGFSAKYNCNKLVYFEQFNSIGVAIRREKQIKNYSRKKKNQLVNSVNPTWADLYQSIFD